MISIARVETLTAQIYSFFEVQTLAFITPNSVDGHEV